MIRKQIIAMMGQQPLREVAGLSPLSISSGHQKTANDYSIYGAQAQVVDDEVVGCGDYDETSGKYIIPLFNKSKNLFDKDGTRLDGYCNPNYSAHARAKTYLIPCKGNTIYTFYVDNRNVETNPRCHISTFDHIPTTSEPKSIGKLYEANGKNKINCISLKTPNDATYIALWNVPDLTGSGVSDMLNTCVVVEGDALIKLNQPLYKYNGIVDVLTKKDSKVHRKYVTIDLGDFTYTRDSASHHHVRTTVTLPYIKKQIDITTVPNIYGSYNTTFWKSLSTTTDDVISSYNGFVGISDDYIRDTSHTNAEIRSHLTGMKIICELADDAPSSYTEESVECPDLTLDSGSNEVACATTYAPSKMSVTARGIKEEYRTIDMQILQDAFYNKYAMNINSGLLKLNAGITTNRSSIYLAKIPIVQGDFLELTTKTGYQYCVMLTNSSTREYKVYDTGIDKSGVWNWYNPGNYNIHIPYGYDSLSMHIKKLDNSDFEDDVKASDFIELIRLCF